MPLLLNKQLPSDPTGVHWSTIFDRYSLLDYLDEQHELENVEAFGVKFAIDLLAINIDAKLILEQKMRISQLWDVRKAFFQGKNRLDEIQIIKLLQTLHLNDLLNLGYIDSTQGSIDSIEKQYFPLKYRNMSLYNIGSHIRQDKEKASLLPFLDIPETNFYSPVMTIFISADRFRLTFERINRIQLNELKSYFKTTLGEQCQLEDQGTYLMRVYGRSWAVAEKSQKCHLQFSLPRNGMIDGLVVIDNSMLSLVVTELASYLGISGGLTSQTNATVFDLATIAPKYYHPILEKYILLDIETVKKCCNKFLELTIKYLHANPQLDKVTRTDNSVPPSSRGRFAFFPILATDAPVIDTNSIAPSGVVADFHASNVISLATGSMIFS